MEKFIMNINKNDIKQLAGMIARIESAQSPTPIAGMDAKPISGRYFMQYFVPNKADDVAKIENILRKYSPVMDTHNSSLVKNTPVIRVPDGIGSQLSEAIEAYDAETLVGLMSKADEANLTDLDSNTLIELRKNIILQSRMVTYFPKGPKEAEAAMSIFRRYDIDSAYHTLTQTVDNRQVIVLSLAKDRYNQMPRLMKNINRAAAARDTKKTKSFAKGKDTVEQKGLHGMLQKLQNWFRNNQSEK